MFFVSRQWKTIVFVIFVSSCLGQEIFRVCERNVCYERSTERERFPNKRLEKEQFNQSNDRISQNDASSSDSLIKQMTLSVVTRHLDDRTDVRHEFLRIRSKDQYQQPRELNERLSDSKSRLSQQGSGRQEPVRQSKGHLDYSDSERREPNVSIKRERNQENLRLEDERILSRDTFIVRKNEKNEINRQKHFERIDDLQTNKRLIEREINDDLRRLQRNGAVSREVSRRQTFQTKLSDNGRIDISLEGNGGSKFNSRSERSREDFHRLGETKGELETSRRFGELRQEPADKTRIIIFSEKRENIKSRSVIGKKSRSADWRSEDHTKSRILESERQFSDLNARSYIPYRHEYSTERKRKYVGEPKSERQEIEEYLRSKKRVIETFNNPRLRYLNEIALVNSPNSERNVHSKNNLLDTIVNRRSIRSEDKVEHEHGIRQMKIKVDRYAAPVRKERIATEKRNEHEKQRQQRIPSLVHERKERTRNERGLKHQEDFEIIERHLDWLSRRIILNDVEQRVQKNRLLSAADSLIKNNLEREERRINNGEDTGRLYGSVEEYRDKRRVVEYRKSASPRQKLSKAMDTHNQDSIQKPSILPSNENMDITQIVMLVYAFMFTFNAKNYLKNPLSIQLRESLRIVGI